MGSNINIFNFVPSTTGIIQPEFIMLVKTDNAGTSASDQFTIPTTGGGYNYDVYWGDGTTSTGVTGNITHTFTGGAGNYVVKISGVFPRIYFNNGGDKLKLLEVQNWGNIVWGPDFRNAFFGCSNMNITATDSPDLSNITNLFSAVFYNCSSLNADLGNWDVSNITGMASLFFGATIYQGQGLENWDVSNVTNMSSMFRLTNFDNNIGNWQLNSALTTMDSIFRSGSFPSSANYTDSIVGWANYVFTNGSPFSVNMANQNQKAFDTSRSGGSNFATAGDARTYLTTTAGWTISADIVI
jgi:surface protein